MAVTEPLQRPVFEDDDDGRQDRSFGRLLVEWFVVLGLGLGAAFLIRTTVLAHFRVSGSSMEPSVHTDERVFVNRLSYALSSPGRGDVVVLHEDRTNGDLIKRVIGLPGETIEIVSCQVYIDGRRLDEPYQPPQTDPNQDWCAFGPSRVPPDMYFVLGDNRGGSSDSRRFGPIPEDEIVGRAFVVFWPFSDVRWL